MQNNNQKNQHSFAFFYPETTQHGLQSPLGTTCTINDRVLCHRILHVLRLNKGELFTLFDNHKQMICRLEGGTDRILQALIVSYECNTIHTPHITYMLPLLKKEAFEEALYALTELGANSVQLIQTKKIQRNWGGQKEQERVERIMQAAAEQSKNFAYPKITQPKPLESAMATISQNSIKIFFDPEGCPLNTIVKSINTELSPHITLICGPEGDLTHEEKSLLNKNGFIFCTLTPTILRAQQAVALSLGALRCLL